MQWTLAAVCALVIGVVSLSLAILPCLHALQQLRERRQQPLPNTNQAPLEQVAAVCATSALLGRGEENEVQVPLSPGITLFDRV
jgi:hypothetical protein